jgi:hypothetical protein
MSINIVYKDKESDEPANIHKWTLHPGTQKIII